MHVGVADQNIEHYTPYKLGHAGGSGLSPEYLGEVAVASALTRASVLVFWIDAKDLSEVFNLNQFARGGPIKASDHESAFTEGCHLDRQARNPIDWNELGL